MLRPYLIIHLIPALVLFAVPVLAQQTEQILFLDTTVNTVFKGRYTVIWRGSDVLVKPADLKEMGLLPERGQSIAAEGETYISLASLKPNLKFSLNENNFTLTLDAETNLLADRTSRTLYSSSKPTDLAYGKDSSAFINYSFNSNNFLRSLNNYNLFTEVGYAFNTSLLSSGFNYSSDNGFKRGFSNLTVDDPDSLNRLVVGDTFTTNLSSLGGSPTIGGVSYGRRFSLDPYLVTTFQDYSLRGGVTTPSTVDIYNNGVFVRREQLPPGQFELRNLPLNTGANNTTFIIRDAFGREQRIDNPNYFSANILKPGLTDYNVGVGLRRQENSNSINYSDLVALGNYRWGATDSLTAGVRLEGANNVMNIGGDVALRLPIGEVGIEAAASSGQGYSGSAGSIRYSYNSPGFGFSAGSRLFSPNYANTSLEPTQDRTSLDNNIQVSFPVLGTSLSLQYQNTQFRDRGNTNRIAAFTSFNIAPQTNLSLNVSRANQSNGQADDTLFVGFSYFPGNSTNASLSYQNQNGRGTTIAQVDKSLGTNDGIGYRVQTQLADRQPLSTDVTLRAQTSFGRYDINYNRSGDRDNTYFTAAGGVAFIGGTTTFTRPLDSSFALVEVPGRPNVGVTVNNNEVGKTGSDGRLVVTGLQPYYANSIGINVKDLPLDYSVGTSTKVIAPAQRAGVVIKFPVIKVQAFLGTLLVKNSTRSLVPSYGRITVTTKDRTIISPLGTEGEFYLENLPVGKNVALVEYEGGECQLSIDIPKKDGSIVELGQLICPMTNIDKLGQSIDVQKNF